MIKFFDAHTHVQFAAYSSDHREVIERALSGGVGMVNVGTQKDTSQRAVDLAQEHDNLYAAVGLHPIHTTRSYHDPQEIGEPVSDFRQGRTGALARQGRDLEISGNGKQSGFVSRGEEFDYEYYKKLALDSKVVAIGECGLDYFRIKNNELEIKEKQKKAFVEQMKLAHEVRKPLMIHCRNAHSTGSGQAFADLIETLIHNSKFLIPNNPGIIHFFSGTEDDAKKLLNMGFSFTFGGVITFVRDYDEVVKMIPPDRILSETDAPYVTPTPYRGKRNEPAYVVEVVKKLAELKEISVDEMAEQVLKNVRRVFDITI